MPLRRLYFPLPVALCLSILFLPFVHSPREAPPLASPSGPITITSRTYAVHFSSSIEINVSANDPISTIAKASIDIDLSADAQQEIHTRPINQAAHTISLSWHEDTSGGHFIPPGTQVTYFWQMSDSPGNTLTDTQQQFYTTNTRCNWPHLTRGMLQVNWYNRSQDFG